MIKVAQTQLFRSAVLTWRVLKKGEGVAVDSIEALKSFLLAGAFEKYVLMKCVQH